MTRIIDSCALVPEMVTADGAETRILTDGSTKWKEVSKHCIDNKKYLIVTPCVNDGYNVANIPSDESWKKLIYDTCKYLQSIGANKYNSKVSLINEPTKFFRDSGGGVVRLTHFINLAYPIIKGFDFRVGAGNMEFYDAAVLGDWYRYICVNANFDDLDIHIQGSCDNEERTRKYTDYAKGLCELYKKTSDCPEAFYGNIATSSGWNLLNIQYNHAKRIGCTNFGNVFNHLWTDAFPILKKYPEVLAKWTEISFKVNGNLRSKYWPQWKTKIDTEGPVPNIPIFEEEDMKLKPVYKNGMNKEIGIKFIQMILNEDMKPIPLLKVDGWWGVKTDAIVLAFQEKYNLVQYGGAIGPNTMQFMIKKYPNIWDNFQYQYSIGAL